MLHFEMQFLKSVDKNEQNFTEFDENFLKRFYL